MDISAVADESAREGDDGAAVVAAEDREARNEGEVRPAVLNEGENDAATDGAAAAGDRAEDTAGLKRCSARHSAAASADVKSDADVCSRPVATAAAAECEASVVVPARNGSENFGGENELDARRARGSSGDAMGDGVNIGR